MPHPDSGPPLVRRRLPAPHAALDRPARSAPVTAAGVQAHARHTPTRSRWSPRARIALALLCLALAVGVSLAALAATRPDLLAWLVVGCVLVVVFGTPLLCVVGLLLVTLWAVSRAGRRRTPPRALQPPAVAHPARDVIVGEVMLDP